METPWRPSGPAYVMLGLHLAVLALPLWIVVDEWLTPSLDANIGFGLTLMWLGVAALPWSLLVWLPDAAGSVTADASTAPVVVAGALLNLALHVWAQARYERAVH